ncbi:hypothetical protein LMG27177_03680 [Paraburkholderia fynbosensis]|uniref:Uncharacterized protein n=1 Tax=Paraburkholderia fynbosensis TaxID=1200993 RepID=A0A6J5G6L3_9BURK|nr:hypothetical protein LMG27177_03680 [Paraburkholderia fynbosensis]
MAIAAIVVGFLVSLVGGPSLLDHLSKTSVERLQQSVDVQHWQLPPDQQRTDSQCSSLVMGVTAIAWLTGCATASDPLEPMNRAVFSFNEGLDRHVATPVATGYTKVAPAPLRTAFSNFFSNLGDITNFANNLLQFKITAATEDLTRFTFNSTFGLGGLLDWASAAGLPKHHQDFGLTHGRYGVPAGPLTCAAAMWPEFCARCKWLGCCECTHSYDLPSG